MDEPVELPAERGYDRWAAVYDSDGNPLVALDERELPELLGPVEGLKLLDLGCGTGRHALRLAAAGARVTALDFSAGMLSAARRKPGAERVRFVRCDLHRRLPLASNSFDRVLNCLVLDHIADLALLFGEMARAVHPDGLVAVTVMHPAMNLKGSQARFVDPETSARVHVASERHLVADYLAAAAGAGLRAERVVERSVDDRLAARYPRAEKYRGWPMWLGLRLRRSGPTRIEVGPHCGTGP